MAAAVSQRHREWFGIKRCDSEFAAGHILPVPRVRRECSGQERTQQSHSFTHRTGRYVSHVRTDFFDLSLSDSESNWISFYFSSGRSTTEGQSPCIRSAHCQSELEGKYRNLNWHCTCRSNRVRKCCLTDSVIVKKPLNRKTYAQHWILLYTRILLFKYQNNGIHATACPEKQMLLQQEQRDFMWSNNIVQSVGEK